MTVQAVARRPASWRPHIAIWGLLLAGCAAIGAHATQAALEFHPVQLDGSTARLAGHDLALSGPDEPSAPTIWEGPIDVRSRPSGEQCTIEAELIVSLYTDGSGRALLVVSHSGATTYLALFDLSDCAPAEPEMALYTEGVSVVGERIEVLPACECTEASQICSCSGGQVLQANVDLQILEDVQASKALTREHLGVAFLGEARVAEPGTANARIVED
jgi:hypothetical protein